MIIIYQLLYIKDFGIRVGNLGNPLTVDKVLYYGVRMGGTA